MSHGLTPSEMAQAGLSQLKQAIIDYLAAHPEGCRNIEIAEALGICSDFEEGQKNYLSWSILGILLGENKIHYRAVGNRRRYFAGPKDSSLA